MKNKKQSKMMKIRLLPLYWKLVLSVVLIFGGGFFGMSLFMGADDIEMGIGFVLMALLVWLLFQIWLPILSDNEKDN